MGYAGVSFCRSVALVYSWLAKELDVVCYPVLYLLVYEPCEEDDCVESEHDGRAEIVAFYNIKAEFFCAQRIEGHYGFYEEEVEDKVRDVADGYHEDQF